MQNRMRLPWFVLLLSLMQASHIRTYTQMRTKKLDRARNDTHRLTALAHTHKHTCCSVPPPVLITTKAPGSCRLPNLATYRWATNQGNCTSLARLRTGEQCTVKCASPLAPASSSYPLGTFVCRAGRLYYPDSHFRCVPGEFSLVPATMRSIPSNHAHV